MSCFSRVIARPVPSIWEDSPPQGTKGSPEIPRGPWEHLPNITIYGSYHRKQVLKDFYRETNYTYTPIPNRENDPVISAMSIPRALNFARTDSMGSIPSLCDDDVALESPISLSPPLASPESPPPTGCSVAAVLGSPGYMGGFGDEHDQPGSNPDLDRIRLQWRERMASYLNPGDKEDTGIAVEHTTPEQPVATSPERAAASPVQAVPRVLDIVRSAEKASRLSQRVRTPPPLNTNAIRAETLLAKLLHGSYDVEVGHTDGSTISDAESGFEGDDEGEYDPPKKSARQSRSSGGSSQEETTVGRKELPKKSYAAAAAATVPRGEAVPGASMVAGDGEQPQQDWTGMFAQRGPLVEVVDL